MRFRQSFMICHEKNIFIQKKYTGRLSKHSNGLPMKPQVNINICRDYILQCVSINAFQRSGYALIKHPSLKGKIQIIIYEHLDSEQAYEQLDDLFNKRLSVSPQCCCFIFDNVILYFIIFNHIMRDTHSEMIRYASTDKHDLRQFIYMYHWRFAKLQIQYCYFFMGFCYILTDTPVYWLTTDYLFCLFKCLQIINKYAGHK